MKKIALSSLVAVMAVSAANAANVIDGNPLYMPKKGHFYSVTDVASHTEINTPWALGEEFGYGITDRLTVALSTVAMENNAFDDAAWGETRLGLVYRPLSMCGWKLDLLGAYAVDRTWENHEAFLDEDFTRYTWTAGVRGGFVTSRFTFAGKALFNYENTESFNWDESRGQRGVHSLVFGVDGQYVIDSNWNLVAGAEYTGYTDKEWYGIPGAKVKNAGTWDGVFGVNYNIDTTKYVGVYVNGSLNHQGGDDNNKWDWDNGFGFGAKFGIDF